ncbi:MAG: cyclic nucleotide-binding domain-containing protein [Candidatus Nitronauta litoralis]|uniref:Cyclic nucleotide-binding domain-containing protein n=1 Tax=Candidatus Nitronauta litoralis TaxID=2705533 RepID=A0A7T0FZM8_9BACT|nr:MAG: cyclic nucleotide-binding domain-containing protein [Candidatus Nitronauta litoralis]
MTTTRKINKGTVVFSEGNFSDTACIIEAGTFEVTKKTHNGADKVIGILKRNDIFGEMGILDGLPRSATVTALEDSQVTVVTKDDFDSLSRRNPNALMPILKVMSMRLRRTLKRETQGNIDPSPITEKIVEEKPDLIEESPLLNEEMPQPISP